MRKRLESVKVYIQENEKETRKRKSLRIQIRQRITMNARHPGFLPIYINSNLYRNKSLIRTLALSMI